MLFRFLITLVSSWVVTPLAVLTAHWLGVANESLMIMLLLGLGAGAPFQLLLNESIATQLAGHPSSGSQKTIAVICGAQALSCSGMLLFGSEQNFPVPETIAASLLLAISTATSFKSAVIYYQLATRSTISNAQSMAVGGLPGLVSLLIFASYGIARAAELEVLPEFLLLAAIAPALAQYALLLSLAGRRHAGPSGAMLQSPSHVLWAALCAIILLSLGSTALRDFIAASNASFAALIIVGLNSLASIVNVVTRAAFLQSSKASHSSPLLAAGGVAGGLVAAAWWLAPVLAQLSALLAAQLWIGAVVCFVRESRGNKQ